MSNPNPPAALARAPRWLIWFGCLALALYGGFLGRNFSAVAGGADSSGYLNSARLLAAGELAMELRAPPEFGPPEKLFRQQLQPHGFAPFEGQPRLSPTYAVGLPLHLALAGRILGWSAGPRAVGLFAALGALGLTYAVSRALGLRPLLAATAAVLIAAYPVFLFMALQPLSDVLATTWCLAAVFAALRARQDPRWALACGAAVGLAVLVRFTNLLLVPALIVWLGADVRRLAAAVLGGLPAALFLGYYNRALYGSAFQSGYVNITDAFGWGYAPGTLGQFAVWLATLLPAVVLVLPWCALGRRTTTARTWLALALWFSAFTGLYACYAISHEVWWDLRFILPATPALVIAALLGLEAAVERWAHRAAAIARPVAAATLAIWSISLGVYWTRQHHLLLTPVYEAAYADAARAAAQQFPPNALVVAGQTSGALYYYTQFPVLRWEFVNGAEFAHYRALAEQSRRPICALLFNVEEREALEEHCRGAWTKLATVRNITLWRLAPATP